MSSKAEFNAGNSSSISIAKSPADGAMQLEVFKAESEISKFDNKEPNEGKDVKQGGGKRFFPTTRGLKSMLRAGMVSNALNTQKGKIRIVHDSHHHKHDKYMIHPLSRFKQVWDICTSIFVFWLVIKVPITLGFDYWYYKKNAAWITNLDIFLEIYFWTDMLIMFNSGFVHDGHVVMSRKASALHYLEFWFWVDIIAQLPYEHILNLASFIMSNGESGTTSDEAKLFRKIVKLVKFFKLAKLLRLGVLVRTLKKHGKYYKTILVVLVFFLSLHMGTCVLAAAAGPCDALDDPDIPYKYNEKRQKIYRSYDYQGLCSQGKIPELYIESLHLCMTLLLGGSIEDIPSRMTAHVWDHPDLVAGMDILATMYMMFGICLFGTIVGFITNIIIHSDASTWAFHARLANVKSEITRLNLPEKLAYRVQRHYDYMWIQRRHHDQHFLDESYMSGHLKRDILLHHYRPFFRNSRLYANAVSDEVICKLAQSLTLEIYLPDEKLFNRGELADRMYLIMKGRVTLYLVEHHRLHDEGERTSLTVGDGKLMGEYEIVDCSPYLRTAITASVCELMSLSRFNFIDALRGHDLVLNKLEERVQERQNMNLETNSQHEKAKQMFSAVRSSLTKRNLRVRKFTHKIATLNKKLQELEPNASVASSTIASVAISASKAF